MMDTLDGYPMTLPIRHLFASFAFAMGMAALGQEPQTAAKRFQATQSQLTADALAQLGSTDPATIAWGAHMAAEFRLEGCIPELRTQLVATAKSSASSRPYVALALLDALIQTKAEVPGAELQPFVTGVTTNSALVLLLPQAKDNLPILLEAYRGCGRGNETFLRCGQELADAKAPGFALQLLREPLWVVLTVWDKGDEVTYEGSGLGVTVACGRPHLSAGFPPSIRYGISSINRFANRGTSCTFTDLESEEQVTARTQWLQQLLGKDAAAVPFDLMQRIPVEWAGLDALRAREQQERTKIHSMHKVLVELCVNKELITAAEAKDLTPSLLVFWMDARKDQKPRITDYRGH